MATSVAGDAAVNPNGIKMLLTEVLTTFPIKGNPLFSNDSKSLPRILLIVLFHTFEFLIILY